MSILVYQKENKELKKLNERLAERKDAFRRGELDQDLSALKQKEVPFTWEGLVSDPENVLACEG